MWNYNVGDFMRMRSQEIPGYFPHLSGGNTPFLESSLAKATTPGDGTLASATQFLVNHGNDGKRQVKPIRRWALHGAHRGILYLRQSCTFRYGSAACRERRRESLPRA